MGKTSELITKVADQITDLAKPSPAGPGEKGFVDWCKVSDGPKVPDNSRGIGE